MAGPVLVGVVGAAPAEAALRHAFDEADRRGAALLVVATGAAPVPPNTDLQDLVDRWAEKYPGVTVETRVRRTVDPALVLAAASAGCALLVVPPPSDVGSSALVDALSRRAHCPVVIAGT
jgi:ABC-type glycerol-3-phosphate transport system substrate-binding protein